ncbi:MAG: cell cycle transcriptional regulator TrcR, partial [Pseudomonadota bacterium]
KPVDPVTLGLCSQIELDEVITKASARRAKMDAERAAATEGPGLQPAENVETPFDTPPEPTAEPSAEDVFSAFKD